MNNEDKVKLLKMIKTDDDFKNELIGVLLSDRRFIDELTMSIINVPIVDIGINIPGTVGEFLLMRKNNGSSSKKNS